MCDQSAVEDVRHILMQSPHLQVGCYRMPYTYNILKEVIRAKQVFEQKSTYVLWWWLGREIYDISRYGTPRGVR